MGVGDWLSENVFDSKNDFQAKERQVDQNAYQYGGAPGGADAAADRYRYGADHAQGRQGEQVNYGQANQDRGMQQQARQGQSALASQMQARAMGQVPSIAQQQADRQMQQARAAQQSMSAGARGAAGVAMAQQNAANNTATAQSQISNQAQINAAQERQQAEGAAMGAYGQMRGQDMQSQGMSAQQAQAQSQFNAQQRAQNDQFSMGFTGAEQNVRAQQMTGQMNRDAQQSANYNAAQGINAGVASQNAQAAGAAMAGTMEAAAKVAGGVAMSDERAKTNVADFVTSTWGTGRGVDPGSMPTSEQVSQASNDAVQRGADARAGEHLAGGMAVPGYSHGISHSKNKANPVSAAQPLQRMDQEIILSAKARQAEGLELSEEEERKLGGAQFRAGNDRKTQSQADHRAKQAGGTMGGVGDTFGKMAANYDQSFRPADTYRPSQLIPLTNNTQPSGIEMKTGLRPLSTRGINPVAPGGDYETSDERAKQAAFDAGKASAHQENADGQLNQAGRFGLASFLSPAHALAAGVSAARSMASQYKASDVAPASQAAKREAKTVTSEDKKPLIIEHGKDKVGVSSKAGRVDEMMNRPSELRTPYDMSVHYAEPQSTQAPPAAPTYSGGVIGVGDANHSYLVGGQMPNAGVIGSGGPQQSDERLKNVDHAMDKGPLANAARSMQGSEYEYKGPFTPPDQRPGEKNVGPMANNMAKDPVARNIVKKDPSIDLPGGGLVLDQGKMVKTLGAIVADLQRQQDEDKAQLAGLASKMRGRR